MKRIKLLKHISEGKVCGLGFFWGVIAFFANLILMTFFISIGAFFFSLGIQLIGLAVLSWRTIFGSALILVVLNIFSKK